MKKKTTVDTLEVAKFAQHASEWWNKDGPLKTLHDINPARLAFIETYTTLAGKTVLDVGCGGGILTEAMAAQGGLVTGLDVVPEAIEAAIQHGQDNQLTSHYVCQPIEDYHAEPFDIVTCMEMLEHVPEPQWIIEHCARLLKPGGYLFLSTLNRTPKAYATAIIAAEYLLGILPKQTHDYKKFLKPSELAALVRHAHLDMIGMAGMAYNPFTREASLHNTVEVNYLIACHKALL